MKTDANIRTVSGTFEYGTTTTQKDTQKKKTYIPAGDDNQVSAAAEQTHIIRIAQNG